MITIHFFRIWFILFLVFDLIWTAVIWLILYEHFMFSFCNTVNFELNQTNFCKKNTTDGPELLKRANLDIPL